MSPKVANSAVPLCEIPERISLKTESSKLLVAVTISNIYLAGSEPEGFDVQKTLIIPAVPCSERDQTIGAYLSIWNKVEERNEKLISNALNLRSWEAAPVTTLGLNVNAFCDLLLGLGEQKLKPEETARLSDYLKGYKNKNTKRNRIVHGKWACSLKIGSTENGTPYIAESEWRRVYTPSAATDRRKLSLNDKGALSRFSFSIADIQNAIVEVSSFMADFRDVEELFPDPNNEPSGSNWRRF